MDDKVLKIRHNVMDVMSINTFVNIKGGMNNHCKDVYFVRALGMTPTLLSDIVKMDGDLDERMHAGRGAYRRISSLPKLVALEEANYYSDCYARWVESNRQEMETKLTAGNEDFKKVLGKACAKTVDLFEGGKGEVNYSIEKNFVVKMIFWFDKIAENLMPQWNERYSVKVVADNVVKKQEYFFFYLLTLVGFDVLLLQSGNDIEDEIDKMNLSKKFVLGSYDKEHAIPEFKPQAEQVQKSGAASGSVKENPGAQNGTGMSGNDSVVSGNNGNSNGRVTIHLPERSRRTGSQSVNNSPGTYPGNSLIGGNSSRGASNGANITRVDTSREKSFEELARLASSIVMIGIHDQHGEIIGSGSGIMIGREGYILTNNHVACGGKFYSVRIEDDDNMYKTDEIIKYNSVQDLAVIRIQKELQPLPIYKGRQKLVRGQRVVAIGSPLGLFNSVSDGIISGFRTIDTVDMIQFTAPTSHGSSGGAVLNMYGEVIGISTSGYDRGQNINLAVGYECINMFIRGFVS